MKKLFLGLVILVSLSYSYDYKIKTVDGISIGTEYSDSGEILSVTKYLKEIADFRIKNEFYENGEVAQTTVKYEDKEFISIIYHKDKKKYNENYGLKCILGYSQKYLDDVLTMNEKRAFTFRKTNLKNLKKEINKFIKFLKTEKISKTVMCTSTGLKLAISYRKGLFEEELVLDKGIIKAPFNKEEEIGNEYRAQYFINKYFKKDNLTIFGIDTGW